MYNNMAPLSTCIGFTHAWQAFSAKAFVESLSSTADLALFKDEWNDGNMGEILRYMLHKCDDVLPAHVERMIALVPWERFENELLSNEVYT